MSGDLVVHPQPYGFGSFPTDWVKTLDALAALEHLGLQGGQGRADRARPAGIIPTTAGRMVGITGRV